MHGTVSNDTKAETIRQLGVQHIINSSKENVIDELRKLDGQVDVIFDSVGGKGVKVGFQSAPGRRSDYLLWRITAHFRERDFQYGKIRFVVRLLFSYPNAFTKQEHSWSKHVEIDESPSAILENHSQSNIKASPGKQNLYTNGRDISHRQII
jgi:hypothetical protein